MLYAFLMLLSINFTYGHIYTLQSNITMTRANQIIGLTNGRATQGITVEFELRYKDCSSKGCAPVLFFKTAEKQEEGMTVRKQCFNTYDTLTFNQYYYSLIESKHDCSRTESGDFVCKASRRFFQKDKTIWFLQFGYECGKSPLLEMGYKMKVETDTLPVCKLLEDKPCGGDGMYVAFPNIFGIHEPGKALIANRNVDLFRSIQGEPCYKYITRFLCLSMYPLCDQDTIIHGYNVEDSRENRTRTNGNDFNDSNMPGNGGRKEGKYLVPCRQMCYDALLGCSQVQRDNNLTVITNCEKYPDGNLPGADCEYKPIICPLPPKFPNTTVEHKNISQVNDTALYTCNQPGRATARETSKSTCLPSGHWSLDGLDCEPDEYVTMQDVRSLLWASPCLVIIVIILTYFTVRYYGRELRLIARYHCCVPKSNSKDSGTSSKVFLTFSTNDIEKANNFKDEVGVHLPECQVITYQEDFVAGQQIVDCIVEGVWHSQAVIVFLSQNYINSEWCEYEFLEADHRLKKESNFRVVIVLAEETNDTKKLRNVPERLKTYITTHIYLWIHETNFWYKLRRALLE